MMPNYPDDYDYPMSDTFRRGLEAQYLGATLGGMPPQDVSYSELLRENQELKRLNRMLNDQLRASRESKQAIPPPKPPPKLKRYRGIEK